MLAALDGSAVAGVGKGLDCRCSSVVERTLGKGEVAGSNPASGFGSGAYSLGAAIGAAVGNVVWLSVAFDD